MARLIWGAYWRYRYISCLLFLQKIHPHQSARDRLYRSDTAHDFVRGYGGRIQGSARERTLPGLCASLEPRYRPIEANDFLSPVTISASAPILNLQIQDKDAAASATLNEHTRQISINLLRPGEAITIVAEVTSEAYRPEISVEMKSADMSSFISGFHSLYPSIVGFCVTLVALGVELALLHALSEGFPAPDTAYPYSPFKTDPGVVVYVITNLGLTIAAAIGVLFLPIIFGIVAQRMARQFLARKITPVAWKFFEFKVSAWTMGTRLRQFRKVIDAEYKKIAPN
jgi:hypothetical protein